MVWIVLLLILGVALFVAELVLLPGITIAAVASLCSFVAAVWLAFTQEGDLTGWITLGISLLIVVVLLSIFLRAKTWRPVALNTNLDQSLNNMPTAKIGDTGRAITRLAPMGKVIIDDKIAEAKTMGEYVDEGSTIEVIGMDNMNIIVKLK